MIYLVMQISDISYVVMPHHIYFDTTYFIYLKMIADNRFKLENMLIRSYAHLRSLELKASFEAIEDLYFESFPSKYTVNCMTRMQGNRYLINTVNHAPCKYESFCVDVDTRKAEILKLNTD